MSDLFVIRIQAQPYSLGHGQIVDQAYAGAREQAFVVEARDIADAIDKACIFQKGMLTSPFVWCAPIVEVRMSRHGEQFSPAKGDPRSIKEAEEAQRKAIALMARPSMVETPEASGA